MELTERDFQPSLLFVKTTSWYKAQNPDRDFGPTDLTVYVYRTDQTGAYMMHGPKMFYTDTPMAGQYFGEVPQDDLAKHAAQLGEVVLWDRLHKNTVLIGTTFADALHKISQT